MLIVADYGSGIFDSYESALGLTFDRIPDLDRAKLFLLGFSKTSDSLLAIF